MTSDQLIDDMACGCLMGRARLVSRVVTGIYEEELRPLGIKASQLNLLVVMAQSGPIRRADIGRLLHLDSSTLTRNLRVMAANGWIEETADGSDGRGLPLQVTAKGRSLLRKVGPGWERAQSRAAHLLGGEGKVNLMRLSAKLLGAGAG